MGSRSIGCMFNLPICILRERERERERDPCRRMAQGIRMNCPRYMSFIKKRIELIL